VAHHRINNEMCTVSVVFPLFFRTPALRATVVCQDELFRLHTSSSYPEGYSEYWREVAGEGQCQEL
jgi:hypothetical protein